MTFAAYPDVCRNHVVVRANVGQFVTSLTTSAALGGASDCARGVEVFGAEMVPVEGATNRYTRPHRVCFRFIRGRYCASLEMLVSISCRPALTGGTDPDMCSNEVLVRFMIPILAVIKAPV
jgi:hypothetical protein